MRGKTQCVLGRKPSGGVKTHKHHITFHDKKMNSLMHHIITFLPSQRQSNTSEFPTDPVHPVASSPAFGLG